LRRGHPRPAPRLHDTARPGRPRPRTPRPRRRRRPGRPRRDRQQRLLRPRHRTMAGDRRPCRQRPGDELRTPRRRGPAVPATVPAPPAASPPVRLADGLAYGGDYNPEQWPREIWDEDVALMREAGVNLVTLGVFAWGTVETADGVRDWSWMDEIIELLHRG